jgi:integrase
MRFTDATIRSLEPPSKGQRQYFDETTPGFCLRVSQGGSKTFLVMMDRQRHTIGRYGVITLAQARAAASRLQAEKTLGRVFPESVPLSSARDLYLSQINVRPATREYYVRHLAKLTGQLQSITTKDINRILDPLPPAVRAQALASFRPFFKWCIKRNYLTRSPCELLTIEKSPSRDRVLADNELKAIWHAAESSGTFGKIIQLLILTGQRKGEIAQLQRVWLREDQIVFPKEVTKNGREHTLPLSALASSVISEQRRTDRSLIFPARSETRVPFSGWSKCKTALDKKLGADFKPWTLHDLRRTFATNMARLGVRLEVTERLLNHVSGSLGGIVGVYQRHDFQPEMRQAVERHEQWLSKIVNLDSLHFPQVSAVPPS